MSVISSQEFLDINGLSRYDGLIKGQIPNLITLTQEQYDLLSEQQKNDPDKYYYISNSTSTNVDTLANLEDVNIQNPTTDQVLAYSATTSQWINRGWPTINGQSLTGNFSTEDLVPVGTGLKYDENGALCLDYQETVNSAGGITAIIGG